MGFKNIIIGIVLLFAAIPCYSVRIEDQLRDAISGYDAEIGVAAIFGKDTVCLNCEKLYPLASVMKLPQAVAVLDYMQRNGIGLGTVVDVRVSDMKKDTYSPMREKYPNGLKISVANLIRYSIEESDNNACDILFDRFVAPHGVTDFLRSLGIEDMHISKTENDMHCNIPTTYNNASTPLAMAELLEYVYSESNCLTPEFRNFLVNTLLNCKTGATQLKSGIGKGASIAHKTGTGAMNSEGRMICMNDAGIVVLPDGSHYSIAVFVKDSAETTDTNSRIISEISAIVYDYFCR